MAKAVRCSPAIAGVLSSHLGYSMRVSWWTKMSPRRFLSGFLRFSPATNFIPRFPHANLIHFVSSAPVMVRQGWSTGILAIHRPSMKGLHRSSSLDPNLLYVGHELSICLFSIIYLYTVYGEPDGRYERE